MKTTKKMLSVLLCIGVLLSMMVFVPANAVMTDVNSSGDLTLSESYVYLINTNNWSSPMCYAWKTNGGNNGAWPGVSMTQVGTYNGYSVYGAEVSTEYDNCIFSNGSSGANQTANLTTQRGKAYNPAIPDWVSVSGGSSEEASTGSGTGGNSGTNTGDGSSFSKSVNAEDFSWDNASVYFLLTDRFKDGNSSNNYSYDRLIGGNGSVTTKMTSDAGSFQGGDFAGIEDAIEEGYFDKLGVNALWISAPYEQIQGYVCSGNGKSSFPHYAYHGYYAGDYSEFDQNFGTAEEFESMVDTAHSHGIRIVLDVVMNHPGYNSMYDMNKFGFGYLKSGWEYEYYSFAGNNNTYHNYITYTDAANTAAINAAWASWWGHDWLRAGISGYTGQGSDDLTGSAGGDLPDFKTESTKTVDVPEFLQNKWKQEGTYTTKINEINSYFSSTGKSKTVRNFLVYWLSQYVEQFGVDGFRCDTAKHVEKASWAALKDGCVEALNKWRANNPDKPGADWDENFWMTGENYGMGLTSASDSYYTQGKFDSMINFSFTGGGGVPSSSSINNTYQTYANNINNSKNYNVLTYISSHDTKLCGRNSGGGKNQDTLIYQGSAFQLMPGAIQIFYGDESGREYVVNSNSSIQSIIASGNHDVRSFMNWNSLDNTVLSHWQKVGSFRNNHIAIGAGSHKSLSATSGVAFERIYNDGTTKDKVICCIAASKNSNVVITVNKTDFPDGTVLKNTYDNTEATVSGGKVTFASGANGTILLEVVSGNEEESSETTPIPSSSETTPIPSSSETTPVPSSSVTTDPSSSETTPVPSSSETTPVPSSSETIPAGTLILGDVNLDDEISIKDATEIQKHIALLSSISAKGLQCADVNGDGYVNVKDGTAIQKYLAKIDTGYAIGCPLGTPSSDPTKATTAPASSETSESSTAATQGTTIPETTVTQPSSSSSDKFTYKDGYVYLYNAASWQDVYVHYWSDASGSSWPGDEMTLVTTINGVGVYEAPVGSENTGLVFNNNGNGLQTANLEYTTGMAYDNKAKNWIDISNLGEGNTNPSSETTDTGDTKKITLVDATPEVWLGHDSAVLVLEDVSTGATYEMTSSGSNSWYAVVPTSVTNIKFNRNDPNTGKTWNSWNAGQCGDNDTYTATSSGVGSWSKGVASSAAANPFVLISPFAFLVNLVLG